MAIDYTNESVLLERLKSQDVKAFEFLYITTRKRLFVLALSIVNNRDVAQDLVHELFQNFWEKKLYEKVMISLKSYLYNTIRYMAFGYNRTKTPYLL